MSQFANWKRKAQTNWASQKKPKPAPVSSPSCKVCNQPLVARESGPASKFPGRGYWACPSKCVTNLETESTWIGWTDQYIPPEENHPPTPASPKNEDNHEKYLSLLQEVHTKVGQVLDMQKEFKKFITDQSDTNTPTSS